MNFDINFTNKGEEIIKNVANYERSINYKFDF